MASSVLVRVDDDDGTGEAEGQWTSIQLSQPKDRAASCRKTSTIGQNGWVSKIDCLFSLTTMIIQYYFLCPLCFPPISPMQVDRFFVSLGFFFFLSPTFTVTTYQGDCGKTVTRPTCRIFSKGFVVGRQRRYDFRLQVKWPPLHVSWYDSSSQREGGLSARPLPLPRRSNKTPGEGYLRIQSRQAIPRPKPSHSLLSLSCSLTLSQPHLSPASTLCFPFPARSLDERGFDGSDREIQTNDDFNWTFGGGERSGFFLTRKYWPPWGN